MKPLVSSSISFRVTMCVILCTLVSCQSHLEKFDSLKVGMDKDDVLSEVGSPKTTLRRSSTDRWLYSIYDQNKSNEREAHFINGVLTYKGQPIPPKISAQKQDQLNKQANALAEVSSQQRKQERKDLLQSFERSVKGDEEVLAVPAFVPVN
jgi:outer membrane protein assembly factor BamE (lipoprotein component of BamABCDE complex)